MKQTASLSVVGIHPSESKSSIDAFLRPVLEQKIIAASAIDTSYAALWKSIIELYNAGGKRLRSYMTLLTYQAYSDTPYQAIIPAAAAQELLHLAMLIHDDIIDRDEIRYGVKNVQSQYFDLYTPHLTDTDERQHYAQSSAMLAGDLLISEAFVLVTQTSVSASTIMAAQQLLGSAIFQVIGGELLDTEATFKGDAAAHPLIIAEQKTASYSFVSPFLMGATLADASNEQKEILKKLGTQLGIAYQIRDDIMGIFGNETITGKSAEGDLREGKRTLLIEEFYRIASPAQQAEFTSLFGQSNMTAKQAERTRELLIESGAKKAVESMIEEFQHTCVILVETLDISETHRQSFTQLIQLCLQRDQ